MNKKRELEFLREIVRTYEDPNASITRSLRLKWLIRLGSFLVLLGAFFLELLNVNGAVCIAVAAIGGAVFGFAEIFAMAVNQIPLMVKYSSLLESEVEKRIGELNAE